MGSGQKGYPESRRIGAVINLGNCLDLLDDRCIIHLRKTYDILAEELRAIGQPLPENSVIDDNDISFRRNLDCSVVQRLHELNNDAIAEELGLPLGIRGSKDIRTIQRASRLH